MLETGVISVVWLQVSAALVGHLTYIANEIQASDVVDLHISMIASATPAAYHRAIAAVMLASASNVTLQKKVSAALAAFSRTNADGMCRIRDLTL